jgi:hypothetical protein
MKYHVAAHFRADQGQLETSQPGQPRRFGRGVHGSIPTFPYCDDISVRRDRGRNIDPVFEL